MKQRFQGLRSFEGAMRGACQRAPISKAVLREIVTFSDEELLHGIDNDALVEGMQSTGAQPRHLQDIYRLLESSPKPSRPWASDPRPRL
jgi:hypothetical protein